MILDSNVLIEIIQQPKSPLNDWLYAQYGQELRINPIIFAELSPNFARCHQLAGYLVELGIDIEPLTLDDCHLAGRAHAVYRRRGGARTTILPDFLIGAQAAARGWTLVTRDRNGFGSYFPDLRVVDPMDNFT